MTSARPLGSIRFRCARKAFDPFLMITVERAGMLVPEFVEEEGALLRLFGQHMTTTVRGSDDPTVIGRRGLVAVDYRRPRESAAGHVLRHDKIHQEANRHPAVFGSECQFRFTGQDLDPIFGWK